MGKSAEAPGRRPRRGIVPLFLGLVAAAVLAAAVAVAGCAAEPDTAARDAPTAKPRPMIEPDAGSAVVYLFNDSGWTLISNDYAVYAGDTKIASLPRKHFTARKLPPGRHTVRIMPEPLGPTHQLAFDAMAASKYYVVFGYNPEKSFLVPLLGDPTAIVLVPEEKVTPVIGEFAYLP
ncbi:MAG: hypothetical protein ACREB6_04235 [Rhodospirillales bacterium]